LCSIPGAISRRQENISSVYISSSQPAFDLVPSDDAISQISDQDQTGTLQLNTDSPQEDSHQLVTKDIISEDSLLQISTTEESSYQDFITAENLPTLQSGEIVEDTNAHFHTPWTADTAATDLSDISEEKVIIDEDRTFSNDDFQQCSSESASDEDSILIQDHSDHWHRFQNSDSEIETVIDFDVFNSSKIENTSDLLDKSSDELLDIPVECSSQITDFPPLLTDSLLESPQKPDSSSLPINISAAQSDFILKSSPDPRNLYLENKKLSHQLCEEGLEDNRDVYENTPAATQFSREIDDQSTVNEELSLDQQEIFEVPFSDFYSESDRDNNHGPCTETAQKVSHQLGICTLIRLFLKPTST
jgi:hypothetical protein